MRNMKIKKMILNFSRKSRDQLASSEKSLANPAAVGLGAFGATTMLLQFHNLGFVGVGAVMWLAFFFGGLAQLVAGFLEYRNGNNFGFAAFTTYGAFWIALGGIWLNAQLKFTAISGTDVGWFLVVFTLLTGIYFIGAMRQNSALAWVFLTLLSALSCWISAIWSPEPRSLIRSPRSN